MVGGRCGDEPRKACESDEVPGPGIDPALAPASGVGGRGMLPYCGRAAGIADPAGDPYTGEARRAVVDALEGE